MKTRTRPHGSSRRHPAGASISHRGSFLDVLGVWFRRTRDAVAEAIHIKVRRRSHLRLVRRNGRPVPVPLRAIIKTRNPHMGRIVLGILLTLSLVAAGIGGSIYLELHLITVPAAGMK